VIAPLVFHLWSVALAPCSERALRGVLSGFSRERPRGHPPLPRSSCVSVKAAEKLFELVGVTKLR